MPKQQAEQEIIEIIKHVGLTGKSLSKYPHEFSGGQRQRISIARALVLKPNRTYCRNWTCIRAI